MSMGLEKSSEEPHHDVVKKEKNGINERVPANFPEGLRAMVIDDDPMFRQYMEKLLKEHLYQVTTYDGAAITSSTLRAKRNNFDIVLCSVHMANTDGFKLLKQILAEMDIPVVMMSTEDDINNIVIKCVTEGACDCLIKPIERKDIITIFKHVMRKMMVEHSKEAYESEGHHKSTETSDLSVPLGKSKTSKMKRMNGEVINKVGDSSGVPIAKKTRVVWTDELVRKFNAVVEKIGMEKAVPKKILELMNFPGLTRENVASHLQKYRQCNRKSQGYPACNPSTSINQTEPYLASLSHDGGINQFSTKCQSLGARGDQLGRPTRNAIDPLLNNGRFVPDYLNIPTRTGYMPHQSQMRVHSMNGLPPLMGQQMFPNGQDNNVRAPTYNLRNYPYYGGGDPRTNYRAAGFPPSYPSIDSTPNFPNFPTNEMIKNGQSYQESIDENCMKWKPPPFTSSDFDGLNNIYPPSAIDQYNLLNSQKNNHGYSDSALLSHTHQHLENLSVNSQKNNHEHSDIILLSQTNHHHHHLESLTGAHLLKPPRMEGSEPKSETMFEGDETKSED